MTIDLLLSFSLPLGRANSILSSLCILNWSEFPECTAAHCITGIRPESHGTAAVSWVKPEIPCSISFLPFVDCGNFNVAAVQVRPYKVTINIMQQGRLISVCRALWRTHELDYLQNFSQWLNIVSMCSRVTHMFTRVKFRCTGSFCAIGSSLIISGTALKRICHEL